jgi:hypothetical protein
VNRCSKVKPEFVQRSHILSDVECHAGSSQRSAVGTQPEGCRTTALDSRQSIVSRGVICVQAFRPSNALPPSLGRHCEERSDEAISTLPHEQIATSGSGLPSPGLRAGLATTDDYGSPFMLKSPSSSVSNQKSAILNSFVSVVPWWSMPWPFSNQPLTSPHRPLGRAWRSRLTSSPSPHPAAGPPRPPPWDRCAPPAQAISA